jgi:dynactin complex subunit
VNNTQLFVTQFVRELDNKIRKGEKSEETAAAFSKQNYELKQKFQKNVQELEMKNKLLESKLKEQNNRLRELQTQLVRRSHVRPLVSASTAGSSSQANTSEDKTSRSLPFVRRMHNIEKEDLAKERSFNHKKRPFLGRSHEGSESTSSHPYSSARSERYPQASHYRASQSY